MPTKQQSVRVPDGLESAARYAHPELTRVPTAALLRIGLAVLAGFSIPEAIRLLSREPDSRAKLRYPDGAQTE
jgi:hypothetical protein